MCVTARARVCVCVCVCGSLIIMVCSVSSSIIRNEIYTVRACVCVCVCEGGRCVRMVVAAGRLIQGSGRPPPAPG